MAAGCANSSWRSSTARSPTPRVGVIYLAGSGHHEAVLEAGGEAVMVTVPAERPVGGVALHREWIADWAQVYLSSLRLDALLLDGDEPEELAGLLAAVLRLDLPVVLAAPLTSPFTVALAALGFAPLTGSSAAEVAVQVARTGGPRPRYLVQGFSLANALRAGLSLGAGPELLVHLAGIAREAGAAGFPQMIRVLTPEIPRVADIASSPFEKHGAAGLFAYLGDTLHDTPSVEGRLKEDLPSSPPALEEAGSRLVFVRGRASGTEVLCQTEGPDAEIYGACRFFTSEEAAVEAVGDGAVEPSDLVVVGGCGPRGGPGLLRLDRLGGALREAGLTLPVLTDGLPPEDVTSTWVSLATPEAAVGGVLWRLRDGDFLRLDLEQGVIRTGVKADELGRREPLVVPAPSGFNYAARYARAALPALEGAGFG